MTLSQPSGLSVFPVPDLPLFAAGDSLAAAIYAALKRIGTALQDKDVVVIAQKVVSKVEGRFRDLSLTSPSTHSEEIATAASKNPALIELISSESQELMRVVPGLVIVRHRTGHVLANAGIDASNVAPDQQDMVMLWPENPDASARRIRNELESRCGARIGVIISDSMGRAWRMGTVGTAIGIAGIKAVRDRRGERDLFGRVLEATIVGVADEIAAAASLVIGEGAEGTPVAIVRGARYDSNDEATISDIIRPLDEDLFR
jgi:coenzyme F420-0:L-glutamate ligase / coenzyme F420-1:gamma-L-glutamate ligase